MTRPSLEDIKSQKNFFRNLYRRSVIMLMIMNFLSYALFAACIFVWLTQAPSDYYSTSGVTNPIQLQPLDQPNRRSVPLLKPDLPDEMSAGKYIPR